MINFNLLKKRKLIGFAFGVHATYCQNNINAPTMIVRNELPVLFLSDWFNIWLIS